MNFAPQDAACSCPVPPCGFQAGDSRIQSVVYRNGHLWAAHTVSATIAGPPVSDLVVVSDGTSTVRRNRLQWLNPTPGSTPDGIRVTFARDPVLCSPPPSPGPGPWGVTPANAFDIAFGEAGKPQRFEHGILLPLTDEQCYAVWALRWSQNVGDVEGAPVPRNGRVYVGNVDKVVRPIPAAAGVGGYSLSAGTDKVKGFLFPDRNGTDFHAATRRTTSTRGSRATPGGRGS